MRMSAKEPPGCDPADSGLRGPALSWDQDTNGVRDRRVPVRGWEPRMSVHTQLRTLAAVSMVALAIMIAPAGLDSTGTWTLILGLLVWLSTWSSAS
jgi:hypothetical protein